jgi:hypothetical protein
MMTNYDVVLMLFDSSKHFEIFQKKMNITVQADQNCTHRGQFVTLYNQRPVVNSSNCPKTSYSCWANLELCEVEVYGN